MANSLFQGTVITVDTASESGNSTTAITIEAQLAD